jgi:pimeloyl-ACP methyl ester carboxylesterase
MISRLVFATLVALLVMIPTGSPAPATLQAAPAARNGAAPVDPPKELDVDVAAGRALESFSVDTGSGLDTGCTGSEGSPLRISIPIGRYIGLTDANGKLQNQQQLINAKVIARYATLIMPAFDVDSDSGEVDEIWVNGNKLPKILTGLNDQWVVNSFRVPIEYLKFPSRRGDNGAYDDIPDTTDGRPVSVTNEIEIRIDVTGDGWCTAIDWAAFQINAMAPLALIHGIGANQDAWDAQTERDNAEQVFARVSARRYLEQQGIPFEWRINLPRPVVGGRETDQTIAQNSAVVRDEVLRVANSFGTKKINLVGHSKGGLDSRGYLAWRYNSSQVRVLTYHTISTPHRGSVLANYAVYRRSHPLRAASADPDIANYLDIDLTLATFRRGPQLPGLGELRTSAAVAFNARAPLPPGVRFFSYGADADVDGDGAVNLAEGIPQTSDVVPALRGGLGALQYRLLRDQATICVERRGVGGIGLVLVAEPINVNGQECNPQTQTPQFNDLLVTTKSSWLGYEPHADADGNHRNIKDSLMLRRILDNIDESFPIR